VSLCVCVCANVFECRVTNTVFTPVFLQQIYDRLSWFVNAFIIIYDTVVLTRVCCNCVAVFVQHVINSSIKFYDGFL